MNVNMVWRNQKLEFSTESFDKESFDVSNPCLKVNDSRTEAAIYRRKPDAIGRHGYLVRVRLPDVSYDVMATREIDALDAFQNFLPSMEIDIAKHVWAVLRAKQMARRPGPQGR